MKEKGVSPMIATIVLIAIVFAIAAALIALLSAAGLPKGPINTKIGVEGFYRGSKQLILTHLGGDTISDAFTIDNGRIKAENWGNLRVSITAKLVETGEDATYNGNAYKYYHIYDNVPEEAVNIDFRQGDVLVLPLKEPLITGSALLVHYAPKNQLLFMDEII